MTSDGTLYCGGPLLMAAFVKETFVNARGSAEDGGFVYFFGLSTVLSETY